jgi:hypothetical protein
MLDLIDITVQGPGSMNYVLSLSSGSQAQRFAKNGPAQTFQFLTFLKDLRNYEQMSRIYQKGSVTGVSLTIGNRNSYGCGKNLIYI